MFVVCSSNSLTHGGIIIGFTGYREKYGELWFIGYREKYRELWFTGYREKYGELGFTG